MSKLTIQQRKQLQEICKETLIKKLSQKEAHTYVNTKLSFEISFDYVQQVRSQLSRSAREQLLRLEKDQYALIQSLFFDRKDELEQMQKVLWSIIDNNSNNAAEKNQLNPAVDNQIKAIEQLLIISDKLYNLYRSLPFEVGFTAKRHFYIHKEDGGTILTPEQQEYIDKFVEASYHVQYKKDFAEMKKKYPMLSDDEIDEKIEEEYFEEGEEAEGDSTTTKKEEESAALLT
jgi:hypothetical protein